MIVNLSRGTVLARRPLFAESPLDRLTGMITRRFVSGGLDAMVFRRCSAVHTFFMRFPLDILFADGRGRVVAVVPGVRPWRPLIAAPGSGTVVELPAGVAAAAGTVVGDILNFNTGGPV